MNQYKVTFEVFRENRQKELATVIVEAGNKKMASLRAMMKLKEDKPEYSDLFKSIKSVEVA